MKKYAPVLYIILLVLTSCKESDAPSPYNLNGLWEGSHTLTSTAGENCEAEMRTDLLRMNWRINRLDTVTITEQAFSDFSKRWFNLATTWRGSVSSDSVVRLTKYYKGKCLTALVPDSVSVPDSVVFRGTVRMREGYLVLDLEGEEIRCPAAGARDTVCTYRSGYQLRKKIKN